MRRVDRRDIALVVLALGLCLSAWAEPPEIVELAPVEVTMERNGAVMRLACTPLPPNKVNYK